MRDRVRLRDGVVVTDGVEEDRGVEGEGGGVKEGEDVELYAEHVLHGQGRPGNIVCPLYGVLKISWNRGCCGQCLDGSKSM